MRPSRLRRIVAFLLVAGLGSPSHGEEFSEKIDGRSVLRRSAPGGVFTFREKIDGESFVFIRAPGGSINFPVRHFFTLVPPEERGSKVDGRSVAVLEAKTIAFNAKIDGRSVVLVILSRDGSLDLFEVNGRSSVYWCKADASDPRPTVHEGRVDGGSEVKEVTRAEMDEMIRFYERQRP